MVLPLLAEHLQLTLGVEDPQAWETVSSLFKRAQPWAVRIDNAIYYSSHLLCDDIKIAISCKHHVVFYFPCFCEVYVSAMGILTRVTRVL